MIEVDALLDDDFSIENISKMIENDIRNRLGFKELEYFELNGKFAYVHPLLKNRKIRAELKKLKNDNPEKFLDEALNSQLSIRRYRSQLNNNKFKDEEEQRKWIEHIENYEDKLVIIKELMSE